MKENSIEKDEEILNNIKAYMQENIDKGYHKFVYNDLGYDEKCVDVINAIGHILPDYKRVLKENEQLSTEVNSLKKENEELKFKERSRIIGKYGDVEIHDVINRTLSNDYIPIQKAKDKIEELEEKLEIMKVDNMYGRYKEYGGKTKQ